MRATFVIPKVFDNFILARTTHPVRIDLGSDIMIIMFNICNYKEFCQTGHFALSTGSGLQHRSPRFGGRSREGYWGWQQGWEQLLSAVLFAAAKVDPTRSHASLMNTHIYIYIHTCVYIYIYIQFSKLKT